MNLGKSVREGIRLPRNFLTVVSEKRIKIWQVNVKICQASSYIIKQKITKWLLVLKYYLLFQRLCSLVGSFCRLVRSLCCLVDDTLCMWKQFLRLSLKTFYYLTNDKIVWQVNIMIWQINIIIRQVDIIIWQIDIIIWQVISCQTIISICLIIMSTC